MTDSAKQERCARPPKHDVARRMPPCGSGWTGGCPARRRRARGAGDIENVAAQAAEDMVDRLAGLTVTRADATDAVKVAMANG